MDLLDRNKKTDAEIAAELQNAIAALDDANGDHWNKNGEPNLTFLESELGRSKIKRAEAELVSQRKRVISPLNDDERGDIKGGHRKGLSSPSAPKSDVAPPLNDDGQGKYILKANLSHDNIIYKYDSILPDGFATSQIELWLEKGIVAHYSADNGGKE